LVPRIDWIGGVPHRTLQEVLKDRATNTSLAIGRSNKGHGSGAENEIQGLPLGAEDVM
jgi:hypothetical protein